MCLPSFAQWIRQQCSHGCPSAGLPPVSCSAVFRRFRLAPRYSLAAKSANARLVVSPPSSDAIATIRRPVGNGRVPGSAFPQDPVDICRHNWHGSSLSFMARAIMARAISEQQQARDRSLRDLLQGRCRNHGRRTCAGSRWRSQPLACRIGAGACRAVARPIECRRLNGTSACRETHLARHSGCRCRRDGGKANRPDSKRLGGPAPVLPDRRLKEFDVGRQGVRTNLPATCLMTPGIAVGPCNCP
jgi:hypothetical protein